MAHGDAREGKWKGNWRMEWVASTLHTTSEHGASSITTADVRTWAASSRLNWRPRRFKWTLPFRRKTKSVFWECAITFQTQSTLFRKWNSGVKPRNDSFKIHFTCTIDSLQVTIDTPFLTTLNSRIVGLSPDRRSHIHRSFFPLLSCECTGSEMGRSSAPKSRAKCLKSLKFRN